MLAASGLDVTVATPELHVAPSATNKTVAGYTPAQIRHAYGFDQVTFGPVVGNGSGQTIAIVDAYGDPNITSDLHTFDAAFGLSDPSFTKLNQSGGTKYPSTNSGWALETALDVEWAHAIAPAAKILLVEASTSSLSNLLTAVDYARKQAGVSVVSMSWGSNEFSGEASYDSHFTTPSGHANISFVASSGDTGALPIWPAVSPNVMAVGGTSLYLNSDNTWQSESGWSGSGGGYSSYESEPTFQAGVQSSGHRTSPDVAYDANPSTGFAVYDSVTYNNQSGWFEVGGTSAGAPQWSALLAIADQGRALSGLPTLGSSQADMYSLAAANFHDVTTGTSSSSSGSFSATTGYDLVTGLGTPAAGSVGNLVVQALVSAGVSATVSTTTTTSTSSGGTGSLALLDDLDTLEAAEVSLPPANTASFAVTAEAPALPTSAARQSTLTTAPASSGQTSAVQLISPQVSPLETAALPLTASAVDAYFGSHDGSGQSDGISLRYQPHDFDGDLFARL